jgi:hypothetical protein
MYPNYQSQSRPMISDTDDAPIYGRAGRIGVVVPANNSVI